MDTSQTNRLNLLTGASVDDNAADAANESADAGGCCGGGSCGCGDSAQASAFDLSGSRGLVPEANDETDAPAGVTDAQPTEYLVTGMTCGHCVMSVKEEIGEIAGVESVEVVLKNGGESRVSVSATAPIAPDAVREAVERAGYQLA